MKHATEIELEAEYIKLNVNANANVHTSLSRSFRWLTRIILCLPMWTTAPADKRNKPRSKCMSIIIIFFIVLVTIYHGAIEAIAVLFWEHDRATYHAMVALLELFATISRFCSLYYFHRHFNFPWNDVDELQSHHQISRQQSKRITKYKWLVLILFVAVMLTEILNLIFYINDSVRLHSPYYFWMGYVLGRIFVFVPLLVTFAAAAVIFAKYDTALLQITEALQGNLLPDGCIDFGSVLNEYETMKRRFEAEYVPSLQWCLLLFLVVIGLELWMLSYGLVFKQAMEKVNLLLKFCRFVGGFATLILFLIPASWMTETFVAFESSVHEYGITHPNEVDYPRLNYLVSYMVRHPLVVRIGATVMTKRSAASIVAGFVVAKLLAYCFQSFGYF